jgi:hypothetical protein
MTEIRSSEYFAIVPEWVVHADISANAVRLYAILNRFANSQGRAWPSRKTIADLMRVSVATIDRAKDELVEIEALTVEARTTPSGDPSSNLYTLHTTQGNTTPASSPMREGILTREGRGILTGDALNRDSMKQRKEHRSSVTMTKCSQCDARNFDTSEHPGKTCTWEPETRTFTICSQCEGTGTNS